MTQIALPRQKPQPLGVGSPLFVRLESANAAHVELLPNPDFTFPQRPAGEIPPPNDSIVNSRPMSLQNLPTSHRGLAPPKRHTSVSALPDFSFNPSGALPLNTPPHSPSSTTPTTPSRHIGHRRGGSEFVGGDGRSGGTTVLSASPAKSEGLLPPPNETLRPAGRRGHAHRRSGAISSHDLSNIMKPAESAPPLPTRAGSAPVTPLEGNQFVFDHSIDKSVSQPSLREASRTDSIDTSPEQRPPSRTRVNFSSTIEYIRPLSTISSGTETSMSTIRGHSATNSFSSNMSGGTSTPPRVGRPSLNMNLEAESRPSTAGAILDTPPHMGLELGADMMSRKRPSSAVSPASPSKFNNPIAIGASAKRRGLLRNDRPEQNRPTLSSSASDPSLSFGADSPLQSPTSEQGDGAGETEKNKSKRSSLKPRKVKSWANSIISRKVKSGSKSNRRPATPPANVVSNDEESSDSESIDFEATCNFDDDNTVTLVSRPRVDTNIASWKPRELKRVDSDTMSPIIDLDAALGPFNTPNGPSSGTKQRGFGAHRRAMHSASGLMISHRRTESAPELVPFELRNSATKTTPTMADVFEEEEPEEDSVAPTLCDSPTLVESEDRAEHAEPKVEVVEAESKQIGSTMNWNFDDGLMIQRSVRRQRSTEPMSPLQAGHLVSDGKTLSNQNASPVEVVEDHEEPRTSSLTHSSESIVTPQLSADESKETQPVLKMPMALPPQSLPTPDTFASSFPSPDLHSSQASFDTPRLGTAASSLTDYRTAMPSPRFMGEPGPELRPSQDGVPSLASCSSTMTGVMQDGYPLPNPRRPGERSSSLCSAPSEVEQQRHKRLSIVSLSRLINSSSLAEKSKLSIEQRPHSEYGPTTEPKKKHKRLSKLMFWKPKDASST